MGTSPTSRWMYTYKSIYYYNTIRVPVFPAIPSLDFSNNVIMETRPFLDSAKAIAASTLGFIEPSANSPAAAYFFASATVISSSHFSFSLPKLIATFQQLLR